MKMMPEQEMEKFWKAFNAAKRKYVESDPRYQEAIEAGNHTKAQELACSFLVGEKAWRKFVQDKIWRDFKKEFGLDD